MRHARQLLVPAALAGTALLAACLDDAPIAPSASAPAQVAMTISVAGRAALTAAGPGPKIVALAQLAYTSRTEQQRTIGYGLLPLDTTTRIRDFKVDLVPCLRDTTRMYYDTTLAARLTCVTTLRLELWVDTTLVDVQSISPLVLYPGRTVIVPPQQLTLGSNAPVMGAARAVLADAGLLWATASASDTDRNLAGFWVDYGDSGVVRQYAQGRLAFPRGSYAGAVPAFLAPVAGLASPFATVQAYDTKYAASAVIDTVPVAPPDTTVAPAASLASGVIGRDSVHVSFTLADPQGDATLVELLVRPSWVDSVYPTSDTLLLACTLPVTPGNGVKRVACRKAFPDTAAQAIVVPFDKPGNVGRAARAPIRRATIP